MKSSPIRHYDILLIILALAWPFINFISENLGNNPINFDSVIYLFLIFLALILLIILGIFILIKDIKARMKAVYILSSGIILFFCFRIIFEVIEQSLGEIPRIGAITLFVQAVLFLAICWIIRKAKAENIRLVLGISLLVMVSVPLLSMTAQLTLSTEKQVADLTSINREGDNRQDLLYKVRPVVNPYSVYVLMLDEYPRHDILKEFIGLDNQAFLDELTSLGFHINKQSLSNYPGTAYSLASLLEGSYPSNTREELRFDTSKAFILFDHYGYQSIAHSLFSFNHSPKLVCKNERLCKPVNLLTQDQNIILSYSPLWRLFSSNKVLGRLFWGDSNLNSVVRSIIRSVRQNKDQQKFFAFIHHLSPHPPQKYDDSCSWTWGKQPDLTQNFSKEEFKNEITCLNQEVIQSIQQLIRVDEQSIILVISDHGLRLSSTIRDIQPLDPDTNLEHSFKNLMAVRLPQPCQSIDHEFTLVNTFRIVRACLEGVQPPLLKDQFFKETGEPIPYPG